MSALLRTAARSARKFSTSAVARKDLVQDLYIKELKAYKPVPTAKDAHVGSVKAYTLPPVPKAPALPTDLAAELTAYDATEPTKAGQDSAQTTTTAGEGSLTGADSFLESLEQDLPPRDDHHH